MTVRERQAPDTMPSASPRGTLLGTFKFRDFRLLWFGLLVSNLGTWIQLTALGYLVVSTAADAAAGAVRLGLIGLCQGVAALVCSPIAGVVADTVPRRRVLLITNGAVAALAVVLAVLVSHGMTALPVLMAISFVSSCARAFDSPARQSWVPILVERPYVSNAIGLNSMAFNLPSAIGPSIAGFLLASTSIPQAFYANALCTLAVVGALLLMRPAPPSTRARTSLLAALGEGVTFLFRHPVLRWIIAGLVVSCIALRPYLQLLPAYTVHVLHSGPQGLGVALGATGLGSIFGGLTTALLGEVRRRARLWAASGAVMGLLVAALGGSHDPFEFAAILFVLGYATMLFVGSSNILIQTLAPDAVRGRAISAFSMIVLGLVPLGTTLIGAVAARVTLPGAFLGFGSASLVLFALLWATQRALRDA